MAFADWYHCSVKMVSRSTGKSAVAAAAYRMGAKFTDSELAGRAAVAAAAYRTGLDLKSDESQHTYDFRRRRGIVTSFTLAPEHAPEWATDPQALWNHAQQKDKRKNSQTAREIVLALPDALDHSDREAITREYGQWLVNTYGVAVTCAIHAPSRHGDDRNYHTHLLMTTRVMGEDGLGEKTRILDAFKTGPSQVKIMREKAADIINDYLEAAGLDERVTHLSYEERGIDKEGTKHLGVAASGIERRGETSERGDQNREISGRNTDKVDLDRIVEELKALDAEIARNEEKKLDERYGPAMEIDEETGSQSGSLPAENSPYSTDENDYPPLPKSPEEEGERLDAANAHFVNQIRQHGEIRHDGLDDGLTWWQRAAEFGLEAWHRARDWARGAWQNFVAGGRAEGQSSGLDQER